MSVEKYAKEVSGAGKPSALAENSAGGLGLKTHIVSPAEHEAGEVHMAEVSGHGMPTMAEKKLEKTFAFEHGKIQEKG